MNRCSTFITRRGFVGVCAAAVARAHAARASKLKFGFTSYEWGADWNLPTMLANCAKAKALGVELCTDRKHKHGVELSLDGTQRRDVKRLFADSPVKLLTVNCGEKFDSPDAAVRKTSVEKTKQYVLLAHDVGAAGVRVFPNDFHTEVPETQTIAQIAESLNILGKFAFDHGQIVRLENHGSVGRLVTLCKILDLVDQRNVRIKLNGDVRDNQDDRFAENLALVKDRLDDTLHMHLYVRDSFPYQKQWDLLIDMGWEGWCIVEEWVRVPDRAQALIEERQIWDEMIAKSLQRA